MATNTPVSMHDFLPSTRPPRNLRVVVVDDLPEILELMVDVLEMIGRIDVVAVAHDGIEAVSAVQVYDPDLVIMDVNMPRMSGLNATLSIREMDAAAKILIMSSEDGPDTRIAALDAGADAFVSKENIVQNCRVQLRQMFPEHYRTVH
ncbi:MAG TPA: response regulator transcription factor [Terriglobales bacterium]|nr:response regulator transcription factor [Terriglobales bacterium]